MPCPKLEKCPFFQKFSRLQSFRKEGFKKTYCVGTQTLPCARLQYLEENNVKPPDELAPSGLMFRP